MRGFTERTLHLAETQSLLREAIIEGGIAVPADTPFRGYVEKAREAISSGGGTVTPVEAAWTRPTDRPAVPTVNENEIYMLFGALATGPNDYAITLTATGGYKADWGDGTIDTIASAVKCEHMYDYASLDITPNDKGVKWVWIKFTPVSGSFTVINHSVTPSLRSTLSTFIPQVYEIYLNVPNVTTWSWSATSSTVLRQLEIFDWQGTSKLSSASYFLCDSKKLQSFSMYTTSIADFRYFMQGCSSFNQSLNIDTSNGTSFRYFLLNCSSFNQPLNLNTNKGYNFSSFMQGCSSFNQSLNINTSNNTEFSSFMYNCSSFNQPLSIDTSKGRDLSNFMYNCSSFNQPLNIDTSSSLDFTSFMHYCSSFNQPLSIDTGNGSDFTSFMYSTSSMTHPITVNLKSTYTAIGTYFIGNMNYALTGLRLLNMGSIHTALTISNSSLGVTELVALFNDLYDRSSVAVGTITITNVFGASQLTAEQKAIAENKNWVIK